MSGHSKWITTKLKREQEEPLLKEAMTTAEEVTLKGWAPRVFFLERLEDETGTSGTGYVAEGVIFHDGAVALRWRTAVKSTAVYDSIEDVEAIHGHGGKTRVAYEVLDEPSEKFRTEYSEAELEALSAQLAKDREEGTIPRVRLKPREEKDCE